MKPLSPVCAKCQSLVDGNAVFLKNGTYMCPACYARAFPVKTPAKPERFFVSVNGVIAIVAVIGVFYGGYKVFQYVMDNQREEARLAKEAEEAAERRHREDALAAEACRKAAELEKKAAETARQSKLDASKLSAEERAKERERQLAEAERKQKDEEATRAHETERQRLEEFAKATETVRARSSELESLANKVAEAHKTLALTDSDRAAVEKKSSVYQRGLTLARSIKSALLSQYKAQFPNSAGDDVVAWRNPLPQRGVMLGRVPIVIDHGDEYRKLVARYDSAVKDIQSNENFLAGVKEDLAKFNKSIYAAKAQIEEVNRRLDELNATFAERAVTLQAAAPKVAMKTIVKKDGSLIKALSIIAAETEVRYTDEAGKWQMIDKGDVKEIQ